MTFRNIITRKLSLLALAVFFIASCSFVSAQTIEVKPKVVVSPVKLKFKRKYKKPKSGEGETSAEKSIAVDAKVNISLCVAEGNLKINGWERSEIRAFVVNGSEVGFKVQQRSRQNNNAVWAMITGSDQAKNKEENSEECLSGEEIELDVPRGATINVKGRTSETNINTVRKAVVKNIGGDISLNNIEQGIVAATYEGDVTVENSGGAITLESGNGNIVAFDVAPSEIGDIFKAKTSSGAITLQRIEHRQTEISSNSGSIKFAGEFQSGGQYSFGTTNGSVSLVIPEKSSCKINASYGFGAFNSELPLQNVKNNPNPNSKAQSLSASLGNGDANVNLTTYSGAIRIKKQ
jgi:hypothetical protein